MKYHFEAVITHTFSLLVEWSSNCGLFNYLAVFCFIFCLRAHAVCLAKCTAMSYARGYFLNGFLFTSFLTTRYTFFYRTFQDVKFYILVKTEKLWNFDALKCLEWLFQRHWKITFFSPIISWSYNALETGCKKATNGTLRRIY